MAGSVPDDVARRRAHLKSLLLLGLAAVMPASSAASGADTSSNGQKAPEGETYDQDSILKDAAEFFGKSTEGLAKVVEKAFKEQGRPNAYIKGQEASGAVAVGLRYGDGGLIMKSGAKRHVYWEGPSIGFDVGANLSKVFILVYHLPKTAAIFQRFPGVDGSLYYVGGAGINYQQRGGIVLAPIRLGVGLRAGASIGYMHYSRTKTFNPF